VRACPPWRRALRPSLRRRDAHLRSGMERGLRETFARLAALLATLAAA
jgi:hypothetical protein